MTSHPSHLGAKDKCAHQIVCVCGNKSFIWSLAGSNPTKQQSWDWLSSSTSATFYSRPWNGFHKHFQKSSSCFDISQISVYLFHFRLTQTKLPKNHETWSKIPKWTHISTENTEWLFICLLKLGARWASTLKSKYTIHIWLCPLLAICLNLNFDSILLAFANFLQNF